MVLARVGVLALLLVFVGLTAAYASVQAAVGRQEAAWSASLGAPNPHRLRDLRQWLMNSGAQLQRQGKATQVSYTGAPAGFVAIVNRLLAEPVEWTAWSTEKFSSNDNAAEATVRGSITLKNF